MPIAKEEKKPKWIFSPNEWLPLSWQESHPDFLKIGAPAGEMIQAELPIVLPPNTAGYRVRILYPE